MELNAAKSPRPAPDAPDVVHIPRSLARPPFDIRKVVAVLAFACVLLIVLLDVARSNSFQAVVLTIVVAAAVPIAVAVYSHLRLTAALRNAAESASGDLAATLLRDFGAYEAAPLRGMKLLTQRLQRGRRFGATICVGRLARPIRPIEVPFEPLSLPDAARLLDQAVAGDRLGVASAAGEARSAGISDALLALLWIVIFAALAWRRGRFSPLIALPLVLFAARDPLEGVATNEDWLVVPGGVVLRKARGAKWRVRLQTRRDSILTIFQIRRGVWCGMLGYDGEVAVRACTPDEAGVLLGAWLSPLAPPPIEQMGDLT